VIDAADAAAGGGGHYGRRRVPGVNRPMLKIVQFNQRLFICHWCVILLELGTVCPTKFDFVLVRKRISKSAKDWTI